jgi:hypothetical protein
VNRLGLLDGLVGIRATLLRLASHLTVALNPRTLGLCDHEHTLSLFSTVALSVINPPPALTRERLAVTIKGPEVREAATAELAKDTTESDTRPRTTIAVVTRKLNMRTVGRSVLDERCTINLSSPRVQSADETA